MLPKDDGQKPETNAAGFARQVSHKSSAIRRSTINVTEIPGIPGDKRLQGWFIPPRASHLPKELRPDAIPATSYPSHLREGLDMLTRRTRLALLSLALALIMLVPTSAAAQCGTPTVAIGPNGGPLTPPYGLPPLTDIGSLIPPPGQQGGEPGICVCWHIDKETLNVIGSRARPCLSGGSQCDTDPAVCNTGCLGPLPQVDADGDGVSWPADPDEPYPFDEPAENPLKDWDDNGLPDCLDLWKLDETLTPPEMRPNPDALLPNDIKRRELLDALHFKGLTPPMLPEAPISGGADDGFVDADSNGLLQFGEAAKQLVNQSLADAATLLSRWLGVTEVSGIDQPLLASDRTKAYNRIRNAYNVLLALGIDKETDIRFQEWLTDLSVPVSGARMEDGGTAPVTIDAGALGKLTMRLFPHPDSASGSRVEFRDENGNRVTSAEMPEGTPARKVAKGLENIEGDPVDTASGEYILESTDLFIRARGLDVELRRVYQSRSVNVGAFGRNWSMPIVDTFALYWPGGHAVDVRWGDGSSSHYAYNAVYQSFVSTNGDFSKLRIVGNPQSPTFAQETPGAMVRRPDGTIYRFCAPVMFSGAETFAVGFLSEIEDIHGNKITVYRSEDGQVSSIKDALGRVITFEYHTQLDTVARITDFTGRVIEYSYDPETIELTEVKRPAIPVLAAGHSIQVLSTGEQYTYSRAPGGWATNKNPISNHNLTSVTRIGEAQPYIQVEYGAEPGIYYDRVKYYTVNGKATIFEYTQLGANTSAGVDALQPEASWATDMLSPEGVRTKYVHSDGLLLRREVFNGRFDGNFQLVGSLYAPPGASTATDRWVTAYTYDSESRVTSVTEGPIASYPAGRKSEYVYDSTNPDRLQQGNVIEVREFGVGSSTNPRITTAQYDPVTVSVTQSTDPAGRTTTRKFSHHEHPHSAVATWARVAGWGILNALTPQSVLSQFGAGDLNGDGLLVERYAAVYMHQHAHLTPTPAAPLPGVATDLETRTRTNAFGQLTQIDDPDGRMLRISYLNGRPTQVTEGTGANARVTQLEYDSLGRVTQELNADRSLTLTSYNALDLPVEVRVRAAGIPRDVIYQVGDGSGGASPLPEDERDILSQLFYDQQGRAIASTVKQYDSGFMLPPASGPRSPINRRYEYTAAGSLSKRVAHRYSESGGLLTTAEWTFEQDSVGQPVKSTEPGGLEESWLRDARGLPLQHVKKSPLGSVVWQESWDYDDFSRVIRHQDEDGRFTEFEYDAFDRVVRQVSPGGAESLFQYNISGEVIRATQQSDGVTVADVEFVRDEVGRIVEERLHNIGMSTSGLPIVGSPSVVSTRFGFTGDSNRVAWSIADFGGVDALSRFEYDALGRQIKQWAGFGQELGSESVLHKSGRLLASRRTYDGRGATGATSPSTVEWKFDYDKHGRRSGSLNPDDGETTTSWTAQGTPREQIGPDGVRIRWEYDSDGATVREERFATTGSKLSEWQHVRDAYGRVVLSTGSLGQSTAYKYNALGHLEERTFADGTVERMTHTPSGRVLSEQIVGGPSVSYSYDSRGRLTALSATGNDAPVTRSISYDGLDRVFSVTEAVGGRAPTVMRRSCDVYGNTLVDEQTVLGVTKSWTAERNPLGAVTGIGWPSGNSVSYTLDALGRVISASRNGGTSVATFSGLYGAERARVITRAGGYTSSREFDPMGRLVSAETRSTGGVLIASRGITYDVAGNTLARSHATTGVSEAMAYDIGGRLASWTVTDPGNVLLRAKSWTWNGADNCIQFSDSIGPVSGSSTYNALDQLLSQQPATTSVAYSVAGAEAARTQAGASLASHWDALGRLMDRHVLVAGNSLTVSCAYDGLDRVVARWDSSRGTIRNGWLDGALLEITSNSGARKEYVPGPDGAPLALVDQFGVMHWIDTDELGSVTGVGLSASGGSRFEYEPFGAPLDASTFSSITGPGSDDGLQYLGAPWDGLAGAVFLGSRILDVSFGRFTSRDPLREAGGPNPYGYAQGNPLRLVDRTGFFAELGQRTPALPGEGSMFRDRGPEHANGFSNPLDLFDEFVENNSDALKDYIGATFPEDGFSSKVDFGNFLNNSRHDQLRLLQGAFALSDWDAAGLSDQQTEQLREGEKLFRESIEALDVLAGIERTGMGLSVAEHFLAKGVSVGFDVSYEKARNGVDITVFVFSLAGSLGKVAVNGGKEAAETATKFVGGGAKPVRTGQAGEKLVRAVEAIGDKTKILVNGRGRIPDGLTKTTLSEVKNVNYQSWTRQLDDYATFAKNNGLKFDLWLPKDASVSETVLKKAQEKLVNVRRF